MHEFTCPKINALFALSNVVDKFSDSNVYAFNRFLKPLKLLCHFRELLNLVYAAYNVSKDICVYYLKIHNVYVN